MNNLKDLLKKEQECTEKAALMLEQMGQWDANQYLTFSKIATELGNVRRTLSTNPNFHPNISQMVH